MEEDHYRVLGCRKDASPEEIKKMYKDKARKLHPDKGGDPEQFKKVNEAYRVLGDPELRSRYDQFGNLDGMDMSSREFPDIFEMFGGGHFPFRHAAAVPPERKTRDRMMDLEVAMEEAYQGVTVKFRFKRKIFIGDPSAIKCGTCNGRGKIVERMTTNMGLLQNIRMCSVCAGTGSRVREHQFKSQAEIVEVIVPPHCHAGYQIVIPQKADEMPGMETGDLILNVVIKKHDVFRLLQQHHLLWEIEIHPLEALTHFTKTVRLPSGEELSIHHKEHQPFFSVMDQWRIVPQKGLYDANRERGNLLIAFRCKDFSITHPSDIRWDQFSSNEPPYHSIPLSVLDLCDPFITSSSSPPQQNAHHPHASFHHAQPQVQECRPS